MKISVVIPVYNEEKRIEETLKALDNSSEQAYEIIVADGRSTDNTLSLIKNKYPKVICLDNAFRKASAGRNLGIKAASGDIIAFTDGDCLVDDNWIKNIRKAFENEDIDGIGGKVLNAKAENKYEEYWGNLAWNLIMSFPDQPYYVSEKKLNDAFVTANCAYKKTLLQEIGGFDDFFGNNAEDVDLCWRALDKNAKLKYVPDVVIYAHNVTDLKGIIKKSYRNGISSSKLQKVYGSKFNFDGNIYKMLFKNLFTLYKKDAGLNFIELFFHLLGKYSGSFQFGVINI